MIKKKRGRRAPSNWSAPRTSKRVISRADSNQKVSRGSGSVRLIFFFFSSRRRHTSLVSDWSSDVCSSDLAHPGDNLLLTLWWQSLAAPGDERSVLMQLLDRNGALVAQADGPPARGGRPTSQWQAGETVIDSRQVALPADLPIGEYTLIFGMYHWPSLERLPMHNGATRQADDVARVQITITR